jgi:hypothetical protein
VEPKLNIAYMITQTATGTTAMTLLGRQGELLSCSPCRRLRWLISWSPLSDRARASSSSYVVAEVRRKEAVVGDDVFCLVTVPTPRRDARHRPVLEGGDGGGQPTRIRFDTNIVRFDPALHDDTATCSDLSWCYPFRQSRCLQNGHNANRRIISSDPIVG